MPSRVLASVLAVALLCPSAASAQSLRAAAKGLPVPALQSQAAPGTNPYKTPALALIGGGAALLVLGLAQDRGVEVNATGTSVTEKGGSKTALTVLGVTAALAGTGLWFWGEQKKKAGPRVQIGPGSVRVQLRF